MMRTNGDLYVRLKGAAQLSALVMMVTFALAGVGVIYGIDGFTITSVLDKAAESNPLHKEVAHQAGAWLANFTAHPVLWAIPLLGVVLPLLTITTARANKGGLAFLFSSLTIACVILTAGVAMFPFVMPPPVCRR